MLKVAVMPGMRPWATAPLTETRAAMIGLLSRDQYLKFFKKDFWEHEVARVGVGALKINQEHLPALFEWEAFKWRHATAHFGGPAANWMQFAWKRLSGDTDYGSPFNAHKCRGSYLTKSRVSMALAVLQDGDRRRAKHRFDRVVRGAELVAVD